MREKRVIEITLFSRSKRKRRNPVYIIAEGGGGSSALPAFLSGLTMR